MSLVSRDSRALAIPERRIVPTSSIASNRASQQIVPYSPPRQHERRSRQHHEVTPYRNDDWWFPDVTRWSDMSMSHWEDDMRRIHRRMFSLLPFDHFGFDDMGIFDSLPSFIRDMHGRMNQLIEQLVPEAGRWMDGESASDYEIGEDGQVHFKLQFDTNEFGPENIQVDTNENMVIVRAKKANRTQHGGSWREYCRMIRLPHTIDQSKLNFGITDDGILVVDAPVIGADPRSITYEDRRPLAIRHEPNMRVDERPLEVRGISGPQVLDDGSGRKRLHLEVTVDRIYRPDDLQVQVNGSRIRITGRCPRSSSSSRWLRTRSSAAEFVTSYETPGRIDPRTLRWELLGHVLVIEARML